MVNDPVTDPAVVGEKTTEQRLLCPDHSVMGTLQLVTANPGPLTATWLMPSLYRPVLLKVSETVLLLPTDTLPKAADDGFTTSCACEEVAAVRTTKTIRGNTAVVAALREESTCVTFDLSNAANRGRGIREIARPAPSRH